MNNLRSLGFLIKLQIFAIICSRTTLADSCSKKPGVCVEAITSPVTLAEGPHWDSEEQVLYFVDIIGQKLYRWDPAIGKTTNAHIKNGKVGVAIPVAGKKNTFIAGAGTDLIQITWDPKKNSTDPEIKVLTTVDADRNGTRFNDGKIDPQGRFWGGTMAINATEGQGSLYRIDSKFVPQRVITPVSISNGLIWSHDNKTFYYIDSPTKQVDAYDYDDATGEISKKRVLFDFTKNNVSGVPDGMTIDTLGNLWIACNGGGRVISVDPKTGKLLRSVELPVKQVSSVAFGGPKLDILYATTGRENLQEKDLVTEPLAGSVFSVNGLGIDGPPMRRFKMGDLGVVKKN